MLVPSLLERLPWIRSPLGTSTAEGSRCSTEGATAPTCGSPAPSYSPSKGAWEVSQGQWLKGYLGFVLTRCGKICGRRNGCHKGVCHSHRSLETGDRAHRAACGALGSVSQEAEGEGEAVGRSLCYAVIGGKGQTRRGAGLGWASLNDRSGLLANRADPSGLVPGLR